ncbi:MAG: DUF6644 family protein [Candidatus Acidiferrales bacterium]|jgi:hypothetical protein
MPIFHFCQWLEATSVGAAIRDSSWLFPVIESIHVLGIVVLVGATGLFDLRLLGGGFLRHQRASQVAKQVMPWVWSSFAVMFVTGVLMFSSEATKCYTSWFFRIKLGLLLLTGLNAFIFQFGTYRQIANWDEARVTPAAARATAWVSLLLWVFIVFAGRGIAYY